MDTWPADGPMTMMHGLPMDDGCTHMHWCTCTSLGLRLANNGRSTLDDDAYMDAAPGPQGPGRPSVHIACRSAWPGWRMKRPVALARRFQRAWQPGPRSAAATSGDWGKRKIKKTEYVAEMAPQEKCASSSLLWLLLKWHTHGEVRRQRLRSIALSYLGWSKIQKDEKKTTNGNTKGRTWWAHLFLIE
jgi:hypothetical protein